MPNYFDLALAISYEAHYHVEHNDSDWIDELTDDEDCELTTDDFIEEGGLCRRAWLDTGRDEVIRDDLICLAAAD